MCTCGDTADCAEMVLAVSPEGQFPLLLLREVGYCTCGDTGCTSGGTGYEFRLRVCPTLSRTSKLPRR